MALTSAGAQLIAQMVNAESVTAYGNTSCYIGVGSGTTAFNSAQTTLVTPLTGGRALVTSGTRSGAILTKATSFGTTSAEGSWEEWGWFNASSGGTMLGRKVESLGTKPAGTQTWQFETTVTFSA
jgi:hypothetical protein